MKTAKTAKAMKIMSSTHASKLLGVLALIASAGVYVACSDDSDAVHDTPTPGTDGGPVIVTPGMDSGVVIVVTPDGSAIIPDGGDAAVPPVMMDCVMNPDMTKNDDIINACTTSVFVDKQPVLPLLLADGGLPPLP